MTKDAYIQTAGDLAFLLRTACECGLRFYDDEPNEWPETEKTGRCSKCRNRKRMVRGSTVDEYAPNIEHVAYVKKDFVSPNHYE